MIPDPAPAELAIQVVLIHHGNDARVAEARHTVGVVAEALASFGHVRVREIFRQPNFTRLRPSDLAKRRLRQWRLERRWSGHLGVSRRWVLSTGLLCLRLLQLSSAEVRANASRQASIELALSAKHELAWRCAYEEGADLLVVLEDDARAGAKSLERIRQLIDFAGSEGSLARTYIDLAGGLSSNELRLSRVMVPRDFGIKSLSRAATNTTCAYAAGQEVIAALSELTISDPASASLPSDWLINRCFLEISARPGAFALQCVHSDPHALTHGSHAGTVPSSVR